MTKIRQIDKQAWAVRLSWLENAYLRLLLRRMILTRKVSQGDLFSLYDQGSLV